MWHNGTILSLDEATRQKRASGLSPPWPRVLEVLKREGITPALVFVATRRQCDALADQCASVDGLVARAHHAGMTLADRLAIERELQNGAIDAIFCTTTLASGIDAPVKTVVIGAVDDGRGRPIPPTMIQQMAGRAGRRGRDSVGFVIVIAPTPGDLPQIDSSQTRPPSSVDSAFASTYQTILRLIVEVGQPGALTFASRSFASFQRQNIIAESRRVVDLAQDQLESLLAKLEPRSCEDPGVTWPKFVAAEEAISELRPPGGVNRLRDGYLCALGIAFAKDQKKIKETLILSPAGTLVKCPFVPRPIADDPDLDRDVHDLFRTFLNTSASEPVVGQWFAFGTPGGARSLEKVGAIQGERVTFGGEGTYLRSRLGGRRAHGLDPSAFGPHVAELLARASLKSSAMPEPNGVPCRHCPAFDRCPDHVSEIQSASYAVGRARLELAALDPEARAIKIVAALQRLGALDAENRPTDLGLALLATHDRAGLFFALARERLARLSPERLALVVAATREVRVGLINCPTDLLPGFYASEVDNALAAEIAAGGDDTLKPLADETMPDLGEDWRTGPVAGDRPSFADRRAYVFKLIWSAQPVDAVGIAPGDVERLLLDTVATLHNLSEIPELRTSATAAIEHLRMMAAVPG